MKTVQHTFIFQQSTDERGRGEGDAMEKLDTWFAEQPATTRIISMIGNECKVLVAYEIPDAGTGK